MDFQTVPDITNPTKPDFQNSKKKNRTVLILFGIVILVVGGIYFFLKKEAGISLPAIFKGEPDVSTNKISGKIVNITEKTFTVFVNGRAGQENYNFSVCPQTEFMVVKPVKNISREFDATFAEIKTGQIVAVVYVKKEKSEEYGQAVK